MSPKLGPLSYAGDDCQPLALRPFSEETAALIDQEAKRIVEECQVEAQRLLEQNRQRLEGLSAALPREESLDEREILQMTGLKPHGVVNPAPRVAQATAG
jgi:cell division protease FtsH